MAYELKHRSSKTVTKGTHYPLGATLTADGVNFALYSKQASNVFLLLFDTPDGEPTDIIELTERDKFPVQMCPAELPHRALQLAVGRVTIGTQDAAEVLGEDLPQGVEAAGVGEVEEGGPGRQGHPDPVPVCASESRLVHVDHQGSLDLIPQFHPGCQPTKVLNPFPPNVLNPLVLNESAGMAGGRA